jgi:predicted nuclease of predicted toxin-antitoxin system
VKFLIDAQLPRRLVHRFHEAGHEVIHTLDLPLGNRTPDEVINELSFREQYIMVTKDTDFVNSFLLTNKPFKLLLVSTGNIKNTELDRIIKANIEQIAKAFSGFDFIELHRDSLIIHS